MLICRHWSLSEHRAEVRVRDLFLQIPTECPSVEYMQVSQSNTMAVYFLQLTYSDQKRCNRDAFLYREPLGSICRFSFSALSDSSHRSGGVIHDDADDDGQR